MPEKNKKPFAIIIDSSAGYDKELLQKYSNLFVFPLVIVVNVQEVLDTPENINYQKMVDYFNQGIIPKTVASNQSAFCGFIDNIFLEYKKIYVLPLSSKYSSTLNNIILISKMHKYQHKLFAFETNSIFLGVSSLIPHLYSDFEKSLKPESIQKKINSLSDKFIFYFVPKDILVLKESGRISLAKELFINLLKLKIAFRLSDKFDVLAKVRTIDMAKNIFINDINDFLNKYPKSIVNIVYSEEFKDPSIVKEYQKLINTKTIYYKNVYSNIIISHVGFPLICFFIERVD